MQCLSLSLRRIPIKVAFSRRSLLDVSSVGGEEEREREVERDDVSLQGEKSERASERATIGSIKRQFAISATTRASERASGIAD